MVQHLKKSYSLSDLTGEKEDENRNTPHMHDETDMEGYWPIIVPIRFSLSLSLFSKKETSLIIFYFFLFGIINKKKLQ